MTRPDDESLIDMIDAIERIQAYLKNRSPKDVVGDLELADAVLYRFTVLGEATKRLSQSFRWSHPEIDWGGVIGFRNHIIHEYDNVDLALVWRTFHNDLPTLLAKVRPLSPKGPD